MIGVIAAIDDYLAWARTSIMVFEDCVDDETRADNHGEHQPEGNFTIGIDFGIFKAETQHQKCAHR